jgi:hypothetical protein
MKHGSEYPDKNFLANLPRPIRIFCPLGVGGNTNHLFVRQIAIRQWIDWDKNPELIFYEDLPYAARISDNQDFSLATCLRNISSTIPDIKQIYRPLSREQMKQKILLAKAYFSQTDYSDLLLDHARALGAECSEGFAEKYYATP